MQGAAHTPSEAPEHTPTHMGVFKGHLVLGFQEHPHRLSQRNPERVVREAALLSSLPLCPEIPCLQGKANPSVSLKGYILSLMYVKRTEMVHTQFPTQRLPACLPMALRQSPVASHFHLTTETWN